MIRRLIPPVSVTTTRGTSKNWRSFFYLFISFFDVTHFRGGETEMSMRKPTTQCNGCRVLTKVTSPSPLYTATLIFDDKVLAFRIAFYVWLLAGE